jgi:hypothetical protein
MRKRFTLIRAHALGTKKKGEEYLTLPLGKLASEGAAETARA